MQYILPLLLIFAISGCSMLEKAQDDAIKTYQQTVEFVDNTSTQVQENFQKTKEDFQKTTEELKTRFDKTSQDLIQAGENIEQKYKDVLNAQEKIQEAAEAINKITE